MLRQPTPTVTAPITVSTRDESNCRVDYEYDDPSCDPAIYTSIIALGSRAYVIESTHSLEALAKWDSKHARLHRKMYPNGRYALPRNPGPYKPVDVFEISSLRRRTVDPEAPFKTYMQPRIARDDKKKTIWALQPGVRIIPVKDVVVIQKVGTAPETGPKYKAIIPKKKFAGWAKGCTGKLESNAGMMVAQLAL